MRIKGTISEITEVEHVGAKRLPKRIVVLENSEKSKLAITVIGVKVENMPSDSRLIGEVVELDVTIESKEWKNRWFTNIMLNEINL